MISFGALATTDDGELVATADRLDHNRNKIHQDDARREENKAETKVSD